MKIKSLLTALFVLFAAFSFGQHKPQMVFVKGGTFMMGNPRTSGQYKGDPDEKPVHKVKVHSFYIGKYEVTVKEYKEFINDKSFNEFKGYHIHEMPAPPDSTWFQGHPATEAYYKKIGKKWWGWQDDMPMQHVTWYDAIAYCNWLSEKLGYEKCYYEDEQGIIHCDLTKNGFRLPTEAEWEYAARGGNKSHNYIFSGSNDYNDVGWVDENTFLTGPRPVGLKKPNELGIYDMTGNVWEWCQDWYSPFFYQNSPVNNPVNTTPTGYRVIRGGSWHYRPEFATVTSRDGPKPGYTNFNYGFRIVRNAK